MAPPIYPDLGKQARDIFSKGYNYGAIKLDVKTKTNSGVEFASGCTSKQDGRVFGNLETKYTLSDQGITFTEKWNTDNILETGVSINSLVEGLKLSADLQFSPHSGQKQANLKCTYLHDLLAFDSCLNMLNGGPFLTASLVLGYEGVVGGYQMKYDCDAAKITNNSFALGFSHGDFVLHAACNDGEDYNASIYHRVNGELEAGVDLQWLSGSSETKFGIGCRYALDKDASVRAKVNNASEIGLGYQQKLRDGITMTISTLIDGKNFNSGGHKLGIGVDMSA